MVTLKDLTTGEVDGNGVFDVLLGVTKEHLETEFKQNRFSGEEYSKIFLSALTTVMAQANQFVITSSEAAAQAALFDAQRQKTLAEIELVNQEKANAVIQGQNLTKAGLQLDKEIALMDQQLLKTTAEVALINQQKANLLAEAANIPLTGNRIVAETQAITSGKNKTDKEVQLVDEQITTIIAERNNIPKQGTVLDKQALKIAEDILLSTSQRTLNTSQNSLLVEQTAKTTQEKLLVTSNITKTDKETAVLEQRRKTEEAQIKDVVDGVSVTGVLGKQKDLYAKQTAGYDRDAEQKAAKILMDAWALQHTTNNSLPPGTSFNTASVDVVVNKLRAGIGAS